MSLVDSSVLIDILRRRQPALTLLEQRRTQDILESSVVVKVEVLSGMRANEEPRTRALIDSIAWHPVDDLIAEEAGRLGRRWLPSHGGIDAVDLIVAATANVLALDLLTTNVKRFPMFPDLAAPY